MTARLSKMKPPEEETEEDLVRKMASKLINKNKIKSKSKYKTQQISWNSAPIKKELSSTSS